MKHPPNTDSTAELYNYGLEMRRKYLELVELMIVDSEFDKIMGAKMEPETAVKLLKQTIWEE